MTNKLAFVNYHGHTNRSFFDALCREKDYSKLANMLNAPSVGVSEHGNICSWIQFDSEMKKAGVNPRLSVEFYFYYESDPKNKKSYHLMATALNDIGFRNILKLLYLSNIPFEEGGGYFYRSRISDKMLFEHRDGLQIGGSCLSGPVSSLLIKGDYLNARLVAQDFKEKFGQNFHLEIFPHRFELQAKINREITQIGKDLGINVIISLDSHYVSEEYSNAYLIYGRNRRRITQSQVESNEECLKDADFYFKTPETCLNILECEHGLERSAVLGAMDYSLQLDKLITFDYNDRFDLPKFADNDEKFLEQLLAKRLVEHFKGRENIPVEYKERLRYEFDVIREKKFCSYFNILHDVLEFCSANEIRLGGRGSVGGSLVAFLLKLFPLDPIEYGLSFDRFLNKNRAVMPDVDLDCASSKREAIINYLKQKWGEKRVVQVITFSEVKAKSAIKEAGTYLEIPFKEINDLCAHIPSFEKEDGAMHDLSLVKALEIPEVALYQRKNPEVFEIALKLEGAIKTNSVHAGGVVLLPDDAENIAPIMQKKGDAGADVPVVAWEKKDLEKIGLVKFDYLGLNLLEVLAECESQTGIKLENVPLSNKKAWEFIQSGKSMKAIFQLSEQKTCKYLRDAKPENLLELAAINSGIRPGTDWARFLTGKKKGAYNGEYDLPEFRKVLKDTYGSILFQESLLFLFSELSDLDLGESDLLRRALEKGDPKGIEKYRGKFITTCKYADLAEGIFDYLSQFTSYSFNLSHSVVYSLNGYWCAYFKANYPNHFLISNIKFAKSSNKMTETEYIGELINEAKEMGINVELPTVLNCRVEPYYSRIEDTVYLGINSLKGITDKPAEVIADASNKFKGDKYNFLEFCDYCWAQKVSTDRIAKSGDPIKRTIVTKAHLRTLIYIGFFGQNVPEIIKAFNTHYKEEYEIKELEQGTNEALGFDFFSPYEKFKQKLDPKYHNTEEYLIVKVVEKKSGNKNGRTWFLVNFDTELGRKSSFFNSAPDLDKQSWYVLKLSQGKKSTGDSIKVENWRLLS